MSNQAFELAILISLKDAASAGADRVSDRLRNMGKEGKATLKTFEDLRKDLKQGFVLGGAGIAGLQMMRGGIKAAGDFESAITELHLSIEEAGAGGAVNLEKLNDQMNRFESLGVKLGNRLPGTTEDFINMFDALKQGGLQTETILKGAGEQVAYLSVLTHSVPKELATAFAEVGEQFQLKPEEYAPSVENFIKNYRAVGLRPEDLIEGTKFAQLRGGLPLGMQGLSGLESISTLLGVLKMSGLKGGVGGREAAAVLLSLVPTSKEQKKDDAKLRSAGVDMRFFDKQGQFLGIENLVAQFEKLRKLSPKQSEELIKKRFGETAMGPIAALSKTGTEGLAKYQERAQSVTSVQHQLNELTQNYNQKLEALEGTFENLKATSFTPILDSLKPALDLTNQLVGQIQEFAKDHPGLAKLGTQIFGISSAALIVTGSVKSLTAAWKLWKIASAVSAGETGLLSFLRATQIESRNTGTAVQRSLSGIFGKDVVIVEGAAKQAGTRLGSSLGRSLVTGLKTVVVGFAVERIIEGILDRGQAVIDQRKATEERRDLEKSRAEVEGQMRSGGIDSKEAIEKLKEIDQRIGESRVAEVDAMRRGGYGKWGGRSEFSEALALASKGYLKAVFGEGHASFDGNKRDAELKLIQMLASLKFGNVEQIQSFFDTLRKSGQYDKDELQKLAALASEVYPQYTKELQSLTGDTANYNEATRQATSTISTMFIPSLWAASAELSKLKAEATESDPEARRRNNRERLNTVVVPSRAMGGDVHTEGLVHVHSGERILPARVTRGLQSGALGLAGGGLTINGGLHVHVPKGSRAAEEPEAFSEYVLKSVTRKVLRQRERR
jgi:TP901 family phage tail tape measure protein